jgi:hypothetical protein
VLILFCTCLVWFYADQTIMKIMERVTFMDETKLTCGEKFRQGKTPTKEITIEGVGTVFLYGTWNAEKLINRLLDCEEITG